MEQERVAVVTGAGSGIGRATARMFASSGHAVACLDSDPIAAELTVEQITRLGGRARATEVDVTDERSIEAALREVLQRFQGVDTVVNAAGVAYRTRIEDLPIAKFDHMWSVNVRGTYLMCVAAIDSLAERQGSIVNLASVAALRGSAYLGAYCATKGAVAAMSAALAVELSERSIRVNCVSPGAVDTPMLAGLIPPDNAPADLLSRSQSLNGRAATADEVAAAIHFLASPDAGHITGVNLPIDGGSRA